VFLRSKKASKKPVLGVFRRFGVWVNKTHTQPPTEPAAVSSVLPHFFSIFFDIFYIFIFFIFFVRKRWKGGKKAGKGEKTGKILVKSGKKA